MILNYFLIFFTILTVLYIYSPGFKEKFNLHFDIFKKNISNVFKNKEKFKIIKLNYIDTQNILRFLQTKFNYDNILVPKDIEYKLEENNIFIFDDIKIIGKKFNYGKEIINDHIISFKFTPNNNDTFISNQDLFGINGNFKITKINENNLNNVNIVQNKTKKIIENVKNEDTENIFNNVPDIIHLTSESEIEIDSIQETTEDFNLQYA
tara:strand:- start:1116 stop:1739 length:624 start_codon:yes stop_codon:yes gene_type:complete